MTNQETQERSSSDPASGSRSESRERVRASSEGLSANILDASLFGEARHHEAAQLDDTIAQADGSAGERVFHLNREVLQPLMYLKLSVAGHMTIFAARTRGPFWSHRPAPVLLLAVVGTQVVATLLSVYGIFMAPIGWPWALFVWGYALAWFLVNDRMKRATYRLVESRRPGFLTVRPTGCSALSIRGISRLCCLGVCEHWIHPRLDAAFCDEEGLS